MNIKYPRNRLKQLRQAHRLSLRALSEKTGIDFATISFCEKGQRNFSANAIKSLSEFFGVSSDYLLGKSPEEMFNGFVDSLHDDFMIETSHGGDDVVQSLSPVVPEPVRTKIEILLLLRGINNKDSLDLILEFTKMRTAHDDFSEPLKED